MLSVDSEQAVSSWAGPGAGVMAHLIYDLKTFFEFDEINIDSWTFKL